MNELRYRGINGDLHASMSALAFMATGFDGAAQLSLGRLAKIRGISENEMLRDLDRLEAGEFVKVVRWWRFKGIWMFHCKAVAPVTFAQFLAERTVP